MKTIINNIILCGLFFSSFGYSSTLIASNTKDHSITDASESYSIVSRDKDFPEFYGGSNELVKFVNKNIRYPEKAVDKNLSGEVIVQFTVNKNGKISNIKVIKSVNPILDKEVVRVVKKMPRWKPANVEGKPIDCDVKLPVNFELV